LIASNFAGALLITLKSDTADPPTPEQTPDRMMRDSFAVGVCFGGGGVRSVDSRRRHCANTHALN